MTDKEREELHIKGLPIRAKNELKNIAGYYGISMNDWAKLRLIELINAQPEHMKKERA